MKTPTRVVVAIPLIFGSFIVAGCDALNQSQANQIEASGVVEVEEVAVSAEIGGRIVAVFVEAGEPVAEGAPLLKVEDEEFEFQRQEILANGEAAIAAAELELIRAEQALEDLHEDAEMTHAQAKLELANARDALDDAEYLHRVRQEGNRASQDTIDAAEARLVLAENEVDRAKAEYDRYSGRNSDDPARAVALRQLANARQDRDAALRALNWYTGAPSDIDQALLDADVSMAEARVNQARRRMEKWSDGPPQDAVELAQARIRNAEAALHLAKVQTESQLGLLDLKLEDTVVQAPLAGVVLTRSIDPGEVIAPGVTLMKLGDLESVRLTVYLPENQYGQVSLGDAATVLVDSFPGTTFQAQVIRIADEAEYTPRNVQTQEDRQTTVYAVELAVHDSQGSLKPGMPADVLFDVN